MDAAYLKNLPLGHLIEAYQAGEKHLPEGDLEVIRHIIRVKKCNRFILGVMLCIAGVYSVVGFIQLLRFMGAIL